MVVPGSLREALLLISDDTRPSVLIGGGTHVMSALNHDSIDAMRTVDISLLEHFDRIRAIPGGVAIGPAVTYRTLLDATQPDVPPLLRQIAGGITGGPQIRNQGTVGGSVCHANPASDLPTAFVALQASMKIRSFKRGERCVDASAFFEAAFRTVLMPDEMLVDIVVSNETRRDRWGYYKLKTTEGSWPVAVAAARVSALDTNSATVTITVGAAAETPFTLPLFQLRGWNEIEESEEREIRKAVRQATARWWTDELIDASYRCRVAGTVAVRAVRDALSKDLPHA